MKKLFLFFLLVTPVCLIAQNKDNDYKIETQYWSIEDGLSHREVQIVYHDTQGFIWIGTQYGYQFNQPMLHGIVSFLKNQVSEGYHLILLSQFIQNILRSIYPQLFTSLVNR